jgi:hypothetical protein
MMIDSRKRRVYYSRLHCCCHVSAGQHNMYWDVSFYCCRFDVSVSVGMYMITTDESVNSTFNALNIPNNVTFQLFIVFQLSDVHENSHL